jgi:hypothetical protein
MATDELAASGPDASESAASESAASGSTAPAPTARPGRLDRLATAPIAAAGLIAGFGVADATGSRPLGGAVLAICGLTCIAVWRRRDGARVTAELTVTGLVAFAVSHVLGRVIGAWPSVIVVSAVTAGLCWWLSDSRRPTTRP